MADVIAVLERVRKSGLAVSAALEEVEYLRKLAARIRNNPEYAVRTLEKVQELDRVLNRQIDKLADEKLEALEYLSILDGEEQALLCRYYIQGMKWERIADKMYMSDRRVFLLRKSALAKLEAAFGGKECRRDYGNRKSNKSTA